MEQQFRGAYHLILIWYLCVEAHRFISGTNLDKMAQSVLFLLQQRRYTSQFLSASQQFIHSHRNSFYPMFPVAEEGEVNLDMSNWHKCDLPFTPDILILPSALQYFAKVCSCFVSMIKVQLISNERRMYMMLCALIQVG